MVASAAVGSYWYLCCHHFSRHCLRWISLWCKKHQIQSAGYFGQRQKEPVTLGTRSLFRSSLAYINVHKTKCSRIDTHKSLLKIQLKAQYGLLIYSHLQRLRSNKLYH